MAVLSEAQFAPISTAASGNTQLVAAVGGAKIRIVGLMLVVAGTVAVKFVSGGSPDLTGAMTLAVGKWISAESVPFGVVETAAGAALNINLGSAVQTSGWLVYVLAT